ncbi:MAG: FKBP-type peptidyl-prolyl cis-trans isomerase [bacterium]|nr:FKBP-type peptidyl-prolyl cis-trans isomerase [bacterium]
MTLKNIMAQILVLSTVALIFSACHKRTNYQTQTPAEAPAPDIKVVKQQDQVKAEESPDSFLHPNLPNVDNLVTYKLDGLRYWFLQEGSGPSAQQGQLVTVHYHGWLADGTTFDSSYQRNQPFRFNLGGRVIPGWNMMVSEMKKGDTVLVEIPSELAYGSRKAGSIPPNSTLYFKIEVLDL